MNLSRSLFGGLATTTLVALAACSSAPEVDEDVASTTDDFSDGSALTAASPSSPGTACETERDPAEDDASPEEQAMLAAEALAPDPAVVYLNMTGGTFTRTAPGRDDPSRNLTSTIGRSQVTVPGYGGDRAALLECVKQGFSQYNVKVVTTQPAGRDYIEAVVAGAPGTVIGRSTGLLGVSPMTCRGIRSTVSWVFAGGGQGRAVSGICWTVLHEAGHALGLEHQYTERDWMSYLPSRSRKAFVDQDLQCATGNGQGWDVRGCDCQRNRLQNTHRRLLANWGAPTSGGGSGGDTKPPVISDVAPANGATFPASSDLEVKARVSDDGGVASVGLLWQIGNATPSLLPCPGSGEAWSCAAQGGAYTWKLRVGTGDRHFRIRARDAAGNEIDSEERDLTFAAKTATPAAVAVLEAPTSGQAFRPGDVIEIRARASGGAPATLRALWGKNGASTAFTMERTGDGVYVARARLVANATAGARTVRVEVTGRDGQAKTTEPIEVRVVR